MPWSRIDSGFWHHPKFEGWKPADKWAFGELIGYCAEYRTEGKIPSDLSLLPRGISPRFLRQAEASGWLEQHDDGALWIHDWNVFHPKDSTAAERMRRHRSSNTTRNGDRNEERNGSRNDDRNETVTHAQAGARVNEYEYVTKELPLSNYVEREPVENNEEQARQQAWLERSRKPDVRSPQGFYSAGVRSGLWPDPFEQEVGVKANASAEGPGAVAAMIRNGVLTDRVELEAELEHVDVADRPGLVAQFELAAKVRENGAVGVDDPEGDA